jgi:hypothetical protein
MKKNDIFTITTPYGDVIKAVCLKSISTEGNMTQYLCYGRNTLFVCNEYYSEWAEEGEVCKEAYIECGETIADNVILPDYDDKLN